MKVYLLIITCTIILSKTLQIKKKSFILFIVHREKSSYSIK